MGISFASAQTFQVEPAARRVAVLDVEGLPKLLDWCVLTRRDTQLSAAQRLLRGFVLERGLRFAACRVRCGVRASCGRLRLKPKRVTADGQDRRWHQGGMAVLHLLAD